jgi:hypothetical protein
MFSSRQGFIYAGTPSGGAPANLLDLLGTGTVTEEMGTITAANDSPFGSGQTVSADFSSDLIKVSDYNPAWDSNWTFEFWFEIDSLAGTDETKVLLSCRPDGGSYSPIDVYYTNVSGYTDGNTRIRVLSSTDGSWDTLISGIGSINLATGTWYHCAVVKNGTDMKVYVDGVQDSSSTLSNSTFSLDPNYVFVGDFGPGGYPMDGRLSNLRFSDTARYTSAFTPPSSPLSEDGDTVFLMPFNET